MHTVSGRGIRIGRWQACYQRTYAYALSVDHISKETCVDRTYLHTPIGGSIPESIEVSQTIIHADIIAILCKGLLAVEDRTPCHTTEGHVISITVMRTDGNAELGVGVSIARETGGYTLLRAILVVGDPRTDIHTPVRRIISIRIDNSAGTVVDAGTSGVISIHGRAAGTFGNTLPRVIRSVVVSVGWTCADTQIGSIVRESLIGRRRAHLYAVSCLIVSIFIGRT